MTSLLLVAVTLFVSLAGVLAAVALARGNRRRARTHGATALAAVALYSLALAGVGLAAPARHLARGQAKCFDDWCVTLRSAVPVQEQDELRQLLTIVVTSRARRVAQRPDSAAAYLVTRSGTSRIDLPGLDQRLEPGQLAELHVSVAVPPARDAQLLITEGGFPARLVIGDENSPWHAKATWAL